MAVLAKKLGGAILVGQFRIKRVPNQSRPPTSFGLLPLDNGISLQSEGDHSARDRLLWKPHHMFWGFRIRVISPRSSEKWPALLPGASGKSLD